MEGEDAEGLARVEEIGCFAVEAARDKEKRGAGFEATVGGLAVGALGEEDEVVDAVAEFGGQIEEAEGFVWDRYSRWCYVFLFSILRYREGVHEIISPPRNHGIWSVVLFDGERRNWSQRCFRFKFGGK